MEKHFIGVAGQPLTKRMGLTALVCLRWDRLLVELSGSQFEGETRRVRITFSQH